MNNLEAKDELHQAIAEAVGPVLNEAANAGIGSRIIREQQKEKAYCLRTMAELIRLLDQFSVSFILWAHSSNVQKIEHDRQYLMGILSDFDKRLGNIEVANHEESTAIYVEVQKLYQAMYEFNQRIDRIISRLTFNGAEHVN